MPATELDLDRLLAPVGRAAFFEDYWERRPLEIARGDPGYYHGVLTAADLDRVVAFTRPKFLEPDAFAPGPPRAASYVQGWLADRPAREGSYYPGLAELREVQARGKTIVLMAMQHRWPAVASLCRRLEAVFQCPVHSNLYLTPGGAQGFDAHFDPHEVLVLQLDGAKTWRLYGPSRRLPLAEERFQGPKEALGTPREVHLRAGDLLYLPRGYVHEAFTSERSSLHLTLGINVFRWVDLLHEALAGLAASDERFRESVPPGGLSGRGMPPAQRERFRMLLDALARDAAPDEALRRIGDRFFGALSVLPDAHLVPQAAAPPIDLDTVLEKRPGALCRVLREGGWVSIEFPGGRVGGPAKIAGALDFVAAHERFRARALPDDLGDESKLVLARRLLLENLLRVADRSEDDPQ